jgi:DNA-binding PadR family transcriptional regulator
MSGKDRLLKRLKDLNTKDCLWMYILRILKDGPAHAYGLRDEIERRFGFRPGTVTAYRVLYHLSSRGFVERRTEGRKKVYSINERGRKELRMAVEFYNKQTKTLR